MKPINHWLYRGWTSLGLLGIVGLASTGHGCASTEEGDYIDPPGFAPQHTSAVALSAGSFVRDRDHVLMTSGLAAQRLRDTSGRPGAASSDKGRLGAVFHGSYADGMTVTPASQPRASVRVVPVQAQAAPSRLRYDGSVVSFDEAFPHVTSAFGARDSRVEEFLVINDEKDVPALAYDLTPGPELDRIEQVEGDATLWAYGHDGDSVFSILPPVADDAAGKHVEGSWILERTATGYRITAQIDLHGLQYPVLLDPTFETPQWFPNTASQPPAVSGAAGAFDINTGCTVIFGGETASAVVSQNTSLRCANRVWKSNIPITGDKPPARAYASMAYMGGSLNRVILFGGTDTSTGNYVEASTWALSLSCTTPGSAASCTGTWTKLATSGSPPPRSFAGMAWTGSSVLLFGGDTRRDTWSFDGSTWTDQNADFGGDYGYYGFGSATSIRGTTRTVYAFGGYDNSPSNPGSLSHFTNTVFQWDGSSWLDRTSFISSAAIPLIEDAGHNTTGETNTTAAPPTPASPTGRYFPWMASTGTGNVLIGSGGYSVALSDTTSQDTFFTDTWMLAQENGIGLGWRHMARPRRDIYGPGERFLSTAVYDENLKEVVLFGGLNAAGSLAKGQVYRGIEREFTLTQSCTNASCSNIYLTVVAPGATAAECGNFSVQFLRRAEASSPWSTVGVSTPFTFGTHAGPNFTSFGSICYARANVGAGRADYGARMRDNRYHVNGTNCQLAADEATTTGGKGACITASAAYVASISCGGALVSVDSPEESCVEF